MKLFQFVFPNDKTLLVFYNLINTIIKPMFIIVDPYTEELDNKLIIKDDESRYVIKKKNIFKLFVRDLKSMCALSKNENDLYVPFIYSDHNFVSHHFWFLVDDYIKIFEIAQQLYTT